jgi:anti-anti-sigma factor
MVQISSLKDSGVLIIVPKDTSLEANMVKSFVAALEKEIAQERLVLFELGMIEYIDSSGIGAILKFMKELRDRGGDLKLCNLQPAVLRIFELVGMPRLIEIYPDRQEALISFQVVPA